MLHGDVNQAQRSSHLNKFKKKDVHVLVATDVAARGLDVRACNTVINFEPANDLDSFIHRIGRTGRAGSKEGVAYTLLTPKCQKAAGYMVEAFENVGLGIPQYLLEIALKSRKFRDRYTDSGFEMKGAKQQGKFGPERAGLGTGKWAEAGSGKKKRETAESRTIRDQFELTFVSEAEQQDIDHGIEIAPKASRWDTLQDGTKVEVTPAEAEPTTAPVEEEAPRERKSRWGTPAAEPAPRKRRWGNPDSEQEAPSQPAPSAEAIARATHAATKAVEDQLTGREATPPLSTLGPDVVIAADATEGNFVSGLKTVGDWAEYKAPDGSSYYFNSSTQVSTYDKPAGF